MKNIAVVVPTNRPEKMVTFLEKWEPLFHKHNITPIIVEDGEKPVLHFMNEEYHIDGKWSVKDIMGKDSDLIFNKNDGVRNLGFAFIEFYLPETEIIITLDDDVEPCGDTIQDHLDALERRVPVSWLSTATEYMRGFPYGVREEAEVVLSHGVWEGVKDYDAPTQLVEGNKDCGFFKGTIPKGIYYPMCGMNIAFKRKMLPYMYYAPMGYRVGMDRFADIWLGIESKKIIDKKGWAVVSGYSKVFHNRASNVMINLAKEAKGIALNEKFWEGDENDPYFKLYEKCRKRWKNKMTTV